MSPRKESDSFRKLSDKLEKIHPVERKKRKRVGCFVLSTILSAILGTTFLTYSGFLWYTYKSTKEQLSRERIEYLEPFLEARVQGLSYEGKEKLSQEEIKEIESEKGYSLSKISSEPEMYLEEKVQMEEDITKLSFNVIGKGENRTYKMDIGERDIEQIDEIVSQNVVKNIVSDCAFDTEYGPIFLNFRYDGQLYIDEIRVPFPLDFSDHCKFSKAGRSVLKTKKSELELRINTYSFDTQSDGFYKKGFENLKGLKRVLENGEKEFKKRRDILSEKRKEIQDEIYVSFFDYVKNFLSDPNHELKKDGFYPEYRILLKKGVDIPESYQIGWESVAELKNQGNCDYGKARTFRVDVNSGEEKNVISKVRKDGKEINSFFWTIKYGNPFAK